MSFQPPQQPPSPGQGLGFGAPHAPASAPSGPSRTGRAHKASQVSPVMIVAALVMIAVAVGVVVLVSGGSSGLDADGAADGFAAVVDDAEFDETGAADLRRCPLGDTQELAERVADDLDLSDDAIDGEGVAYVQDESDGYPATIWCYQTETNPLETFDFTGVTLGVSELPRGDWADFIEETYEGFGADVTVEDPKDFRGGTIHPYCFEPDEGEVPSTCGADWVHEDAGLVIGLSHTTDDGDPGPAVTALEQLLPSMVDALAEQA